MAQQQRQEFDYFLVLDFEATCDDSDTAGGRVFGPQEVIEFPVLKVDAATFQTVSVFHEYVRPVVHTTLTRFCTQLTGISQEQVDSSSHFPDVLSRFTQWLVREGLLEGGEGGGSKLGRWTFITCGHWDLRIMLATQCKVSALARPQYFDDWINVKLTFKSSIGQIPGHHNDLLHMLEQLGLEHEGRHHSGIDDCRNIVNVVSALALRIGCVFEVNGRFTDTG